MDSDVSPVAAVGAITLAAVFRETHLIQRRAERRNEPSTAKQGSMLSPQAVCRPKGTAVKVRTAQLQPRVQSPQAEEPDPSDVYLKRRVYKVNRPMEEMLRLETGENSSPRIFGGDERVKEFLTVVVMPLPLSRTEPAKAWRTASGPAKSGFVRDDFQLVLAYLNVSRLRLAPNTDAVDLRAARPKRAAKLDNTRS
jgi:hypothetical protein